MNMNSVLTVVDERARRNPKFSKASLAILQTDPTAALPRLLWMPALISELASLYHC